MHIQHPAPRRDRQTGGGSPAVGSLPRPYRPVAAESRLRRVHGPSSTRETRASTARMRRPWRVYAVPAEKLAEEGIDLTTAVVKRAGGSRIPRFSACFVDG